MVTAQNFEVMSHKFNIDKTCTEVLVLHRNKIDMNHNTHIGLKTYMALSLSIMAYAVHIKEGSVPNYCCFYF
jgi:hypothetical protein